MKSVSISRYTEGNVKPNITNCIVAIGNDMYLGAYLYRLFFNVKGREYYDKS